MKNPKLSPSRIAAYLAIFLALSPQARVFAEDSAIPLDVVLFADSNDPDTQKRRLLAPPEELRQAVTTALARGGFIAQFVPEKNYSDLFAENPSTDQRVKILFNSVSGRGQVLLIETGAHYYDVMPGQFKWVLQGRITLIRANADRHKTIEVDGAAFLKFRHEGEYEALTQFAPEISRALADMIANGELKDPDAGRKIMILGRETTSLGEAADKVKEKVKDTAADKVEKQ